MSIKMKKMEGLIELGKKALSPDLHLLRDSYKRSLIDSRTFLSISQKRSLD